MRVDEALGRSPLDDLDRPARPTFDMVADLANDLWCGNDTLALGNVGQVSVGQWA